jgi:hypothetical protein
VISGAVIRRRARNLARIGLQVQIHTLRSAALFAQLATPGARYDVAYDGCEADYPDPDNFLSHLLDDSSIGPTLSDPLAQRQLAAAERLSGPQRYRTYGALDLDLARNIATLAAYGNGWSHDFFSVRIGCKTFGFYVMDLGALCTRTSAPRVIRSRGPAVDRDGYKVVAWSRR